MSLEDLQEEYRSIRAPRSVIIEAVGRFETSKTVGTRSWTSIPAWSLAAVVVLGVVALTNLLEKTQAPTNVEFSMARLTMPVGPAMPSLVGLSAPRGADLTLPSFNQISLSPAKETMQ